MRKGFSLVELLVTIGLMSITSVIALPRFTAMRDRLAVHAAGTDVLSALHSARQHAWERARRSAVTFDTIARTVTVLSYRDTLERRPLQQLYGVRLNVTRDSVAYAPNAMGYGAANTRIIVARGAAAETLTVSRLGRVRR